MALFHSVLYVFFQFYCVDYRPLLFDLFVAVSSTRDKVSQSTPLLMHLSLAFFWGTNQTTVLRLLTFLLRSLTFILTALIFWIYLPILVFILKWPSLLLKIVIMLLSPWNFLRIQRGMILFTTEFFIILVLIGLFVNEFKVGFAAYILYHIYLIHLSDFHLLVLLP